MTQVENPLMIEFGGFTSSQNEASRRIESKSERAIGQPIALDDLNERVDSHHRIDHIRVQQFQQQRFLSTSTL